MQKIYKYPVNDCEGITKIKAPIVKVLDIQYQFFAHQPVLWALIDDELQDIEVVVTSVATGAPIVGLDANNYFKTLVDGYYVWHFFVEGAPTSIGSYLS